VTCPAADTFRLRIALLITPIAAGPVVLIAYSVGLAAGLGMVVIANRFLDLQGWGSQITASYADSYSSCV
jgi:hypothetical protein